MTARGDERSANDQPESDESVEEIRADIEETRVEMGDTLGELGDRLEPSHLVEQAKENVRDATIGRVEETARGMSDMVVDTIKRNPIPAAMAGIGLAWLWANRSQDHANGRRYDQHGYVGESRYGTGRSPGDKLGEVTDRSREEIGNAASQIGEGAQQIATDALGHGRHTAQQVGTQFDRLMQNNPLALGVVAMGTGAVVGALIPETQPEREMLGETSQQVSGAINETVSQAMDKVEEQADKAEEQLASKR